MVFLNMGPLELIFEISIPKRKIQNFKKMKMSENAC